MYGNASELERLVDMAEEVSQTVNSLNVKITNLRMMFIFSIASLYAAIVVIYITFRVTDLSTSLEIGLLILSIILLVSSLIYLSKYFRNNRSYRQSLKTEIQILHRLLDMVYEYKENIHVKDMSYVEQAILDMKLQRIKYSSKW